MVVEQRKDAVCSLDQRGAALDPIAAVIIGHLAELADSCTMDVAAKDRVNIIAVRIIRYGSFIFAITDSDTDLYRPLLCSQYCAESSHARPSQQHHLSIFAPLE